MTNKNDEIAMSRPSSQGAENVEEAKPVAAPHGIDDDPEFTLKEQRRIIHRIDRRLVVMLGLIYCVSLIDRTNLSNAAIAGMTPDLELNVGFRYVCLSIFNGMKSN